MANHASAEIRQAPGWWPSLVQVTCDCGYVGRVHDLNARMNATTIVKIERDTHRCGEDEFDAGEPW